MTLHPRDGRLLVTKLHPPSAGRATMLERNLPAWLHTEKTRLYLISAPAGAGKTTLLCRLWEQHAPASVWLSLDTADNDPLRFLAHLAAAIGGACPAAADEALTMLRSHEEESLDLVLAALINSLAHNKTPLLICLDDYHELQTPLLHRLVNELLRFLPPEVSLAIASRQQPPLALGQLRAQGAVRDVSWEDLRFTTGEVTAYLLDTRRLAISHKEARRIAERTEGWPAGLQLVATALERGIPLSAILTNTTDREIHLSDFLLESVWSAQPAEMRKFLLDTALLERFCEPLCQALGHGGRIKTLIRENLFVFQLHGDCGVSWHRYHHLFRDFLVSRRPDDDPGRRQTLLAAAQWCAGAGYLREALAYALACGADDFAADLLQATGRGWFQLCDTRELRDAIARLPPEQLQRRPGLVLLLACAMLYLGEFSKASASIAALENDDGLPANIAAEACVLRVILGVVRTDEPDLRGWNPVLLSNLAEDDIEIRALGQIAEGYAERATGTLAAALCTFDRAAQISAERVSPNAHLVAAYNRVILRGAAGDLIEAEITARRELELAEDNHWRHISGTGFVHAALAIVLYDQFRLDEALESIDWAIEILRGSETLSYLGVALCDRARILFACGEPERAYRDLRAARSMARDHNIVRVQLRAELVEMRADLQVGRTAAARAHAASAGFSNLPVAEYLSECQESQFIEILCLLVAERAVGQPLLVRLDEAIANARRVGRLKNALELEWLRAPLLVLLGSYSAGAEAIQRIRNLAVTAGFFRLVRQQISSLDSILPGLSDESVRPGRKTAEVSEKPVFRKRETQILQLLAEGQGNREIGQRLFISETTVKWYLKHLYEMLGVNNRTAAVARARQHGVPGV